MGQNGAGAGAIYYDIASVVAGDGSNIPKEGPTDPGGVAEINSTDFGFYSFGDPYGGALSGDGSTVLAYRDTGSSYAVAVGPGVELGDGLAYYSDNGQTLYYATPSTPGVFFSTPLAVAYNTATGQTLLSAINGNGSVFNGTPVGSSTNQNATLLYSFGATYFSDGSSTQWNDGQGFYIAYNSPAPVLRPHMDGAKFAFVHQSNGTATLSGTSDAIGQQVEIDIGSAGAGTAFATVASDGTWSASFAQSLITSNVAVYVSVTSAAGTPTLDTGTGEITYSSPAPTLLPHMAAGKFIFLYEGNGPATLSGTSNAIGQQVELDVGSPGAGTAFATVAADGSWSVSVAQSLITSNDPVYLSVTSAAGTPTLDSGTGELVALIDTPVLSPFLSPTSYAQPYIYGTADAGDTVTLYDGTTELGTTVVGQDGNFYFPTTTPLSEGLHRITAVASDALGDVSAASAEQDVTIDLTAPAETVAALVAAGDNVVSVLEQASGLMTVTGTLSAPLAAGDSVWVQVAGGTAVQATATVGSTSFTALVAIPAIGSEVQAYVQDAAGNQTATTSQAFTVTPVNAIRHVIGLSTDYSQNAPSLSQNGGAVAFVGTPIYSAPNPAPSIEVANLATGTVVNASGALPNVSGPSLSGDGSEVAFVSADAATFTPQIYVDNVTSGTMALVSHAAGATTGANHAALTPRISEDGQHVVFTSFATNLTADAVFGSQIYEADLAAGAWTVKLVSQGATGAASGDTSAPSVSADGRVVAFTSSATNLAAGVGNSGNEEIYATVYDAEGNATVELVSSNAAGVVADSYSQGGVVSGNGRYVVFQSGADNLVPGGGSSSSQIYRKDLVTGTVVLVSADAAGNAGTDSSSDATISDDGNLVAFETYAPNLTNAPATADYVPLQVVVKNLTTGAVYLASSPSTADSESSANGAVLSGDGSEVAFASTAQDLVAGTTGFQQRVYTSQLLADTNPAACYLHGTLIATPAGERRIETLAIGDMVTTADGAARAIRWIGRRSYDRRFAAGNPDVIPIRIARGAIADGVPHTDLLVSPHHAMFLGGVLIPAKLLVNGATITEDGDITAIRYVHLELASHDILLANGAPSESFVDCDSRTLFQNAAEYDALYPNDPGARWAFCAPRIEDGHRLEDIRAGLALRAGLGGAGAMWTGTLEGHLDIANLEMVTGWAWQPDHPGEPVRLEIVVDGGVVAMVVANRERSDVRKAGYGTGRYGFELTLPKPLSPFSRHVIEVRRHSDKQGLTNSPRVLEPVPLLDSAARQALAAAIGGHAAGDPAEELEDLLGVLLAGTERLLHARRAQIAAPPAPARRRRLRPRPAALAAGGPLALVIDDRMPTPDADGGSGAVMDHMLSLKRLGYRVGFVPRDMAVAGKAARALEQAGIVPLGAPFYAGVEDVLRQHAGDVALVYVYRVANMTLYGAMVRHLCPKARLVYSVADLHFLREARQEAIRNEPDAASRRLREKELAAARMADAVITHSTYETNILGEMLPGLNAHTVPWSFAPRRLAVPFRRRAGVAFIGSYDHRPNLDAAVHLVEAVMPLVWRQDPSITCMLVGSNMPAALRGLTGGKVVAMGHVADLNTVFDTVRLTVAPLRYGAGLKGKVLQSLAAGVPCVCSTAAAEGMDLPPGLMGRSAAEIAALILRLHNDAKENARTRTAGRAFLKRGFRPEVIDAGMTAALARRATEVVAVRRRR